MVKKRDAEQQLEQLNAQVNSLTQQTESYRAQIDNYRAQLEGHQAQIENYRIKENAIAQALTDAHAASSRRVAEANERARGIIAQAEAHRKQAEDLFKSKEAEIEQRATRLLDSAQSEIERKLAKVEMDVKAFQARVESLNDSLNDNIRLARAQADMFARSLSEISQETQELAIEGRGLSALIHNRDIPLPDDYNSPNELMRGIYQLQGRDIPSCAQQDMPYAKAQNTFTQNTYTPEPAISDYERKTAPNAYASPYVYQEEAAFSPYAPQYGYQPEPELAPYMPQYAYQPETAASYAPRAYQPESGPASYAPRAYQPQSEPAPYTPQQSAYQPQSEPAPYTPQQSAYQPESEPAPYTPQQSAYQPESEPAPYAPQSYQQKARPHTAQQEYKSEQSYSFQNYSQEPAQMSFEAPYAAPSASKEYSPYAQQAEQKPASSYPFSGFQPPVSPRTSEQSYQHNASAAESYAKQNYAQSQPDYARNAPTSKQQAEERVWTVDEIMAARTAPITPSSTVEAANAVDLDSLLDEIISD